MPRLISVVIPVRNGARYLGEAIGSVLASVAAANDAGMEVAVEVIVVDNGSSDGSRALAESFGEPVRVIVETQCGAAQARNAGVELARGEYLAFLDADDLWMSAKLGWQLQELDARTDLDMVFTFGSNFLSPDLTAGEREAVYCDSRVGPFILPSAMLARREMFVRVGPLPDLPEGEFIAWYGVAIAMGVRSEVIPEALVRRRIHLSNSTRLRPNRAGLLQAAKMVLDHKRAAGS